MRLSRSLKLAVLLMAGAGVPSLLHAQSDRFQEGTHFRAFPEAQETMSGPGTVEVAEIFMYSCIHCYRFEPHIESWSERRADYVEFVRIPAVFNDWAALLARAYYAAVELGKIDDMHAEFFREIHDRGNPLNSEAALREFFLRFGVDVEDFDRVFGSSLIDAKVDKALELARAYRINATPSMVINGKYLSMGDMAGSYDTWFEIIDDLAASEHEGS